jgi:hypothetical protein
MQTDHYALERLDTLSIALPNAEVDSYSVSGPERTYFRIALRFDKHCGFHGVGLPSLIFSLNWTAGME